MCKCASIPFFGQLILWQVWAQTQEKFMCLEICHHQRQKELQSFLGVLSYLSKFSPMTVEVCKPLQKAVISKDRLDMEQDVPRSVW